ncbi:MAG: hypothetical protein ACT4PO_12235 [Actinomycetota bacterium]
MGLRSWLARRWGSDLAEAVATGAIDSDDHLYRSTTTSKRDLPSISHDRAQEICYKLYRENALGHRLTEIIPDFIVGDGIGWSAKNPHVAELVAEFWEDDVNRLELRVHDFANELGLYGELIPEGITGEGSGVVRLGYIDSSQVKAVTAEERNPLATDVVWIREKGFGQKGRPLQIIRDRGSGHLSGDVFFFRVNSPSNATRGWPDLLHVADWIHNFDQMLWEVTERSALARNFIWDVLLEGFSQEQVDDWLRRHGNAPLSGSVRAHNEKVTWSAVAPQLGAFEIVKEIDAVREHIAGSFGIPKHWLSAAADVNRATAMEMSSPTTRRLSRRQVYFLACLKRILRYVLEQAEESGRLETEAGLVPIYADDGKPTDRAAKPYQLVELHAPAISPRDAYRGGQLLTQAASGFALAKDHGWLDDQTIRRALGQILAQMGVPFDPATAPQPSTPPSSISGNGKVKALSERRST